MKISSASLIAAALASIASSAIAAAGPLHARALEAVKSFDERDLGVDSGLALLEREIGDEFVDNLFTRAQVSAEEGARLSADANGQAARVHRIAKEINLRAHEMTGDIEFSIAAVKHGGRAQWHDERVEQHTEDREAIAENRADNIQKNRSHRHKGNVSNAEASEKSAKESSRKAKVAIEEHKKLLRLPARRARKHKKDQVAIAAGTATRVQIARSHHFKRRRKMRNALAQVDQVPRAAHVHRAAQMHRAAQVHKAALILHDMKNG